MNLPTRGTSGLKFVAIFLVGACAAEGANVRPQATPSSAEPAPPASPAPAEPTTAAPVASSSSSSEPTSPPATTASSTSSASLPPIVPAQRTPRPIPKTQKDCKACNGNWGIHGLAQTPSCVCPTTDGGNRCRDGLECQSMCIAADTPDRIVTDAGPPARGYFTGACSKFFTVFGCYRPIEDGASKTPVELTNPPQMICAD